LLGAPLVLRTSQWFFELNRTVDWLLGKEQWQNYNAVLADLEAPWAWCQLAFVDFGLPLKQLREVTAETQAVTGGGEAIAWHEYSRAPGWSGHWLLVQRVLEQSWSPAEAARAQGVSVATCYKWLGRYRAKRTGRAG
jgi:hypothetical protein